MAVDYNKSYEIVELDNLEFIADASNGESRYYCPFCYDKRGKPDKDGKFYYNKEKKCGWCFKCNTVGFGEDNTLSDLDKDFNRAIFSAKKKLTVTDYTQIENDLKGIRYDFDRPNNDIQSRLVRRNPFLPLLTDKLLIRSWNNKGYVIPVFYRDIIPMFQIRFINPAPGKPKYYIWPKGQKKLVYSPDDVLSDFKLKNSDTITICEGVYDAIALRIMGYPNPLAIFGSSISNFQIYIIRKLIPQSAIVAMDDPEVSKGIVNSLKKISSISESLVTSFNGKDPEEYLLEKVRNTDTEFVSKCYENVKQWLT